MGGGGGRSRCRCPGSSAGRCRRGGGCCPPQGRRGHAAGAAERGGTWPPPRRDKTCSIALPPPPPASPALAAGRGQGRERRRCGGCCSGAKRLHNPAHGASCSEGLPRGMSPPGPSVARPPPSASRPGLVHPAPLRPRRAAELVLGSRLGAYAPPAHPGLGEGAAACARPREKH